MKLKIGDKELTQKLEISKDPRSAGSLEDIKNQIKLQMQVREDLNVASDMVSQIEWMKKQLYDLREVLAARGGANDVLQAVGAFDTKLQAIEDELFQPTIAEGDTKSFRDPQKVYEKLSVLAGDISGLVDFAPNKQQLEVYAMLKENLGVQKDRLEKLIGTDLVSFNEMLKKNNIAGVIFPGIK